MFYSFLRNCARLFYIIVYHIHVIGGENIPKEKGGYIIASNHVSNNDPPVVGITFKGKYTFMAKEELFEINPIFSWLISKLGAFPVRRGAKDNTAIEKALESLGEGRKAALRLSRRRLRCRWFRCISSTAGRNSARISTSRSGRRSRRSISMST